MKRKGFTLVELLVVIAIIALLMSILMPALARVQELARRVVCGTNTSGIVKAMLVYANDSETGRFPHVGPPSTTWSDTLDITGSNPTATISSALYLLVHFEYCSTKQFVCKSDPAASELKEGDPTELWDFGDDPSAHNSYAYHTPYAAGTTSVSYGLSGASEPSMAVVADRSPDNATDNSTNHGGDGQNVAYIDAHVKFQKVPQCGVSYSDGSNAGVDNIYTIGPDEVGAVPAYGEGPGSQRDSVLVSK